MRASTMTTQVLRPGVTVALAFLMLLTPFISLAQEATPASDAAAVMALPAPGGLQVTLTGSTGVGLSASFAVSDSAGGYQEVWVVDGFGQADNLAAGTATVTQLTGTTDYAIDAVPRYVEIPSGSIASLSIINHLLDADGDGVGDAVDACPAGNDAVDTDQDGIADACDTTPAGDPTPEPTTVPTIEPTVEPVEEMTVLSVEVADEPVAVEDAPVSCQQAESVSPWIKSDLDDYPPGGLVTLSGGSWAPGQVVELLVEDDGLADAERGEWNHTATVTADASGSFTYAFTIAPWFVADYTVIATGECSKVGTSFTDSVSPDPGNCTQIGTDLVTPNDYATYRCDTPRNQKGQTETFKVLVEAVSPEWQWAAVYSSATQAPQPVPSEWSMPGAGGTTQGASGNEVFVYIFFRPTNSVPVGGPGSMVVKATHPGNGTLYYRSTLTANRTQTNSLMTKITGATMDWTRTYALTPYEINPGSLTYQVIVGGSSGNGWNVQVSASPFTRAEGGNPVPASNLALTGSTNPGITGITRPATTGSLATPVKVLSATATVPAGTYTQRLDLNMNIPGGTLVGTYTSNVTITAAAGP